MYRDKELESTPPPLICRRPSPIKKCNINILCCRGCARPQIMSGAALKFALLAPFLYSWGLRLQQTFYFTARRHSIMMPRRRASERASKCVSSLHLVYLAAKTPWASHPTGWVGLVAREEIARVSL